MARKRKRADGRYVVSLSIAPNKRKYFYSTESAFDAEQKKQAWLKANPDYFMSDLIDDKISVEAWSKRWLASYKAGLQESTKRWYAEMLKNLLDFTFTNGLRFGSMRVSDVRPVHLAEYVNTLAGQSKSAIRSKKMILRSMFDAAVENHLIEDNPAERLPKVAGTYEGHRALSRQEAALVTANYAGHRFGLPAMVMMWAGLRKQECFALRWEDIDLKENIIHVRRALDIRERSEKATKTENSVRDVPIFAPLQLPLQRAYKARHGQLVFTQEDGGVCSKSSINRGLESFLLKLKKVSGEDITFKCHDLRDTFATMCYDAGVDVKTTQKWMGHADAATTMKIYTKLSEERQKESTDLMDGFVAAVLHENEV